MFGKSVRPIALDRRKGQRLAVILGGAGFLGSHLSERLLDRGYRVVCVDSFVTGRPENVEGLLANRNFELVEHDIVEPFAHKLERVDEIYNLACPASPPHYQADPLRTALTCSVGTYNGLLAAQRHGARFFHASTSEIYGDPEVHPQTEDYRGNVNTVGPRSCYDEGKRFAETLVTDFGRQHGVTTRIARIFNTYGPRMQADDGRVVSNFIVQALKGDDITIYGSGEQTRSFCFVSDLVEGFIRLMAVEQPSIGPVNLGNPVETTVGELARMVVEMVGSSATIVHRPLPVDDPRRRKPSIERAKALLGWSPQVELAAGLAETVAYFRQALSAAAPPVVSPRAARPLLGSSRRDLVAQSAG